MITILILAVMQIHAATLPASCPEDKHLRGIVKTDKFGNGKLRWGPTCEVYKDPPQCDMYAYTDPGNGVFWLTKTFEEADIHGNPGTAFYVSCYFPDRIVLPGDVLPEGQDSPAIHVQDPFNDYWTCKDKSRAVMGSVDGSKHWCHKAEQ